MLWLLSLVVCLEAIQAAQIPFSASTLHDDTAKRRSTSRKQFVTSHSAGGADRPPPSLARGDAQGTSKPLLSWLRSPAVMPVVVQPRLQPALLYPLNEITLNAVPAKVWRPRNAKGGSPEYLAARQASLRASRNQPHPTDYAPLEWDHVDVEAPDVTDVETLSGLAKMCSNAYFENEKAKEDGKGWYDLGDRWTLGSSFGWAEDGVRGHVFATEDNSTIVVAIKGTSAGKLVGGGGSTGVNDKTNDNLLFSCCCARVDWSWSTVCDCYKGGWECGQTCVEDALITESVYYPLATDLYNNITQMYPNSNIWLTGHSLGGSLASLLALTFGVPAVTFEAVADLLPAKRLHLPLPPGRDATSDFGAITHVYHNADPIPQCVALSHVLISADVHDVEEHVQAHYHGVTSEASRSRHAAIPAKRSSTIPSTRSTGP